MTPNPGSHGHVYRHEMEEADHIALLEALKGVRGSVVLSGYSNPLYQEHLSPWVRVAKDAQAQSNKGSVDRVECLWLNPPALVDCKARSWRRSQRDPHPV